MPVREQQKTNKQHAVPQNIMDVEFKLIGSLTMRQFVYLVVFAIMAYMAKLSVPQPFTWFFALGIALAGIALAFVPIEERGLDEWLVNFIKVINSPTERIWKKEVRLPQAFSYNQQLVVMQKELITLAPTTSRRKLEEFLQHEGIGDKEDPLDIPEAEYIQKIKDAYK
ncbi:MAG TPA: PrgI family protein, partial [candidate division WWE3 bacterium]|nr:PrgI family protein [candidate division WWE3 bacterium]